MRRNWLEWAILVVSLASIIALVGYLAVEALRSDGPAEISIVGRPAEARQTAAGWEIPVTVRNDGGQVAAGLTIEASASVAGETETAGLVLALVAPGTEVDLVFAFSGEPDGEVTYRLIGYESP